MKKYVLTLVAALFCAVASAGDGFYIGAGAAGQVVPAIDGTRFSVAPAVELGYKTTFIGVGVTGSMNGEAMISLDINSGFMVAEPVNIIFGCGYGAIYRKMNFFEDGHEYSTSGFINWPHANIGIEFGLTDNLGVRLIGALGYARCTYEGNNQSYGYYDDYYYYARYNYDGWNFAAQIRASLVWNF